MNLRLLLSLLLIAGMIFVSSCGSEEKQPELDKIDSVDELIEEMEAPAETIEDTVEAVIETPAEVKVDADDTKKPAAESTPQPKAGDYSTKPLEGTVVSLNALVMGGNGKVSKAEAQNLQSSGNLILFRATNGTVYFVYNEDGSFAGKRLANFANNDKVGLLGKAKTVNGINTFVMTLIEGM
ncbi:MAG: hypothetical protein KIT33_05350 [Candidatus Kapabacteria bacterium]|nr:hypothetical protein [Ignavibacteriota bacterium]MCW5884382.1 hypothetical protein [Candidatus Kapabacteria bacterium]